MRLPRLQRGRIASSVAKAVPQSWLPGVRMAETFARRPFWRRVEECRAFVDESERWSMERLEAYQLGKIQALLHHAYDNVPYYRRVFDDLSMKPDDVKHLDDLRHLPTIGKRELQDNLSGLLATNIPARRRAYFTTGGSTGTPVGFYHDRVDTRAREWAFMSTQWARVGYRDGDRTAILRGTVISKGLFEPEPLQNALLMSSYHLTDDRIPLYLERLRAFRPAFVRAYPSSISLVARYMLEHAEPPINGLRAILCGSENLYDWQRDQIETAFQTRVYSWYGQSEAVCLAGECEHDSRLHIFPQYGYVEILDEEERRLVEPGKTGEIVATGFLTRAMPLIRYRTMDVASFAPGTCESCGRPYRLFERVEGRLQEYIVTATGRHISMTAINMHSPVFDNVQQFRFYQDTPGRVTLKVLPKSTYDTSADDRRIRSELAPKLGNDLALTIEPVDDIPRTPRGKHGFLDQKLPLTIGDRQ
jgi:phenylacetate-CoA ligase